MSQTPLSPRPKPTNCIGDGRPSENEAKSTGRAAATKAVTGAAIPIRPIASALYSAAMPTAPMRPAALPHPSMEGDGPGSARATASTASETAPTVCDTNNTA